MIYKKNTINHGSYSKSDMSMFFFDSQIIVIWKCFEVNCKKDIFKLVFCYLNENI